MRWSCGSTPCRRQVKAKLARITAVRSFGGRWLDALSLTGWQQSGALGVLRHGSVNVPCGTRQPVQIGRKALLVRAWSQKRGAHAASPRQNLAHKINWLCRL